MQREQLFPMEWLPVVVGVVVYYLAGFRDAVHVAEMLLACFPIRWGLVENLATA